jgi:hypothetical protein
MEKDPHLSPRGRIKPILKSKKDTLIINERISKVLNKVISKKDNKQNGRNAFGRVSKVSLDLESSSRRKSYSDLLKQSSNSMKRKMDTNSKLKPNIWGQKVTEPKGVKKTEAKPKVKDYLKKGANSDKKKAYMPVAKRTSFKAPVTVDLYRDSSSISNRSERRGKMSPRSKDLPSNLNATNVSPIASKSLMKKTKNVICLNDDDSVPKLEEKNPPNVDESKGNSPHIDLPKSEKCHKALKDKPQTNQVNPISASPGRALTSRGGTKSGLKSFNDVLNTQKRAFKRLRSLRNVNESVVDNIQASKLQERIDKSVQDLYKQYISSDFETMKEKARLTDKLIESLRVNDKCVKKANMITFFFINFYKNFEQNIIIGMCCVNDSFRQTKENLSGMTQTL